MATNNKELTTKLTAQAPAGPKPASVADQVRHALEKMKSEIALALPKHCTPDRMARIALTEIRSNPRLLDCTIESLLSAVMKASQLGLEPGLIGHCYFVPFRNNKSNRYEVQFIVGYKGLIDLVRRSGQVTSIGSYLVYENDRIEIDLGEQKVEHKYSFTRERGKLIGVYAFAVLKDGGRVLEPMTLAEVEKIRRRSKAADSGPWVSDFEEMVRKTVIRRICKYLPISIERQQAIAEMDAIEFETEKQEAPSIDLGDVQQIEHSETPDSMGDAPLVFDEPIVEDDERPFA